MLSEKTINKIKNRRKKPEYYKVVQTLKNNYNIIIFSDEFLEQGKGSFGKCYLGKIMQKQGQKLERHFFQDLVQNNQIIAIKILPKENRHNTKELYEAQIKNLAKINHQNVVKVFPYTIQSSKNYYMIMEYCNNCTLYELIQSRKKKKFTIQQFTQIMLDLIHGYKAIRTQKLLHNDLKPKNILIQKKVFKIGDFGLSLKLNADKKQIHYGTLPYTAPQKLVPNASIGEIDHKSDIYSLGLILYEVLYGKHPFFDKQSFQKFRYEQQQRMKKSNTLISLTPTQLKLSVLHKYIEQQSKKPKPTTFNLQTFNQQGHKIAVELQKIVQDMCVLDKSKRLSLEQIFMKLSSLGLQKKIDRIGLFNDLSNFSSSQFKFQISKMSKFDVSKAQEKNIQNKMKSSESFGYKRLQQVKSRLDASFELICNLKKISEHLFELQKQYEKQLQKQYEKKLSNFTALFNNYLYSVNLRELKLLFQQQSTMSPQELQAIESRQDISTLVQKLFQNDSQLYDQVNISVDQSSPDTHRFKLVQYIKDLLRNWCIEIDTWSQTIAWIVLYKFIDIECRHQNNENKEDMQDEIEECQRYFKLFNNQDLKDNDIREGDLLIRNNQQNFLYFYGDK